jgi:hypothetical protein
MLSNRKAKTFLIIVLAASVVGGGIRALGALGSQIGLEEPAIRRSRTQSI